MAFAVSALVALFGAIVLLAEGPGGGHWNNQPDVQVEGVSSDTPEAEVGPWPTCKSRGGECGIMGRCGEKPPVLYRQASDCNRWNHQMDCCIYMNKH